MGVQGAEEVERRLGVACQARGATLQARGRAARGRMEDSKAVGHAGGLIIEPAASPDVLWQAGDSLAGLRRLPAAAKRAPTAHEAPPKKLRRESTASQDSSWSASTALSSASSDSCETEAVAPIDEAALVLATGQALEVLAAQRPATRTSKLPPGPFVGASVPRISLPAYLQRMVRYLNEWQRDRTEGLSVGARALVLAMVYVDRLCTKRPDFALGEANVHRLLMVALLEATKFVEDVPFPNTYWSRVGGVSLRELNALEAEFLGMLDFDMAVGPAAFSATLRMLVGGSAGGRA